MTMKKIEYLLKEGEGQDDGSEVRLVELISTVLTLIVFVAAALIFLEMS